MKLLVLFLVCSIGLTYASDGYAQKAMISIEIHNQRVEDVLKEIETQSDFNFFDKDGTRVEIMDANTIDGIPTSSSTFLSLKYIKK